MEQLAFVIGAFLLYLVVLPILGMLIGTVLYLGLPYAFGGIVAAMVFVKILALPMGWVFTLFLAGIWACLVGYSRAKNRAFSAQPLAWHEGHFGGAFTVLTMGLPYQARKQNSLAEGASVTGVEV